MGKEGDSPKDTSWQECTKSQDGEEPGWRRVHCRAVQGTLTLSILVGFENAARLKPKQSPNWIHKLRE